MTKTGCGASYAQPGCRIIRRMPCVRPASSRKTCRELIRARILIRLIRKVVVHDDRVETEISVAELINQLLQGRRLGIDGHGDGSPDERESTVVLTSICRPVRRGIEMRLVIEDQPGSHKYRPDPTLIAAVAKAHVWWGEIYAGRVRTTKEIADRKNSDERYVARIIKLAFLAPDITAAILDGRQPPELNADMVIKMSDLPCSWALQRQRLGMLGRADRGGRASCSRELASSF